MKFPEEVVKRVTDQCSSGPTGRVAIETALDALTAEDLIRLRQLSLPPSVWCSW